MDRFSSALDRWRSAMLGAGFLLLLGLSLWILLTQRLSTPRSAQAPEEQPTLHPADATKLFPLTRLAITATNMAATRTARPEFCLLYTSDAADE